MFINELLKFSLVVFIILQGRGSDVLFLLPPTKFAGRHRVLHLGDPPAVVFQPYFCT